MISHTFINLNDVALVYKKNKKSKASTVNNFVSLKATADGFVLTLKK